MTPLRAALNPADSRALFDEHVRAALRPTCGFELAGELNGGFVGTAFGKLYMSDVPGLSDCPSAKLIAGANAGLRRANKTTEVGTNFDAGSGTTDGIAGAVAGAIVGGLTGGMGGIIVGGVVGLLGGEGVSAACNHPGDYDMALSGLIPIAYRYRDKLEPDVYQHILHELLSESGGSDKVRTTWAVCDAGHVPETENHIMMTESARYLTNQLLLQEAQEKHVGDPQSPELALAHQKYDNTTNGMDRWMLNHLQGFMKSDFHEYNARPYARLSILGIHNNLAEYAEKGKSNRPVATAARLVLDYLAARFAVSSSGLRRAVPFRRHYDHLNYTPFFNNNSDEETWWAITMFGTTQTLIDLYPRNLDFTASSFSRQVLIRPAAKAHLIRLLIPHELPGMLLSATTRTGWLELASRR